MSGAGEIIDLNYTAVNFVMDLHDITNKKEVFQKVTKVFSHFLEEDRKKKNKNNCVGANSIIKLTYSTTLINNNYNP